MHPKLYTVRGCVVENGKNSSIQLDLEFDGKRAFVIWDSVSLGALKLKARVEINPKLLKRVHGDECDYLYRGQLVLPHPEYN